MRRILPDDNKIVTVRVEPDLYDAIVKGSDENGQSRGEFIRRALRAAVGLPTVLPTPR